METEWSVPCSQQAANCHYAKPDTFSPHSPPFLP